MVINMRDNLIKEKIIEAAKQDVPDVLARIKDDRRYKVPEKKSLLNGFKLVKLIPYASALVIVFALLITLNFNDPTPVEATSTVYIEINPSIEIDLNEDDEIIDIRSNNDEAQQLLNSIDTYEGKKLEIVLERFIQKAIERGYLTSANPFVMYDVSGKNETVIAHIEAVLSERVPEIAQRNLPDLSFVHGNAKDQTIDEINDARRENISIMKYRLINRVLETREDLTFQELKSYTIGELRDLLVDQDDMPMIPNRPNMPNRPNS